MKDNLDKFIKNIPKNIHSNTRTYISKNIAVFIPEEFVIERKVKMLDYHFVIFHTTPPPVIIDDKVLQYKKGSFVCIEPGIELTVNPLESVGTVKFISISINKDFFENIASDIVDMKNIKFMDRDNAYSNQLLSLIEMLIKEIIAYGERCPLMVDSIETQIVIQILRDSMPNYLIHRRNNNSNNEYIDKSIKYMEEYYGSNINIKEICDTIFISPCHFQRIFKKNMNQTPYNYLMRLRVNKAKEKLINDESNIEEIARICGFLSISHFSTVFKRLEGISPTEYRKNNINNI